MDNMPELVIKTAVDNGDLPKKKELFSDEEINSNKILEIDYKDIRSDPMQLIDILNKRNQYHNTKKE